jgi:gas vesicle protein
MEKSSAKAILGFAIGAAAGVALGILFAPDRGSETRKKIKNKAVDLKDDIVESVSEKIDDLKKHFSHTKADATS